MENEYETTISIIREIIGDRLCNLTHWREALLRPTEVFEFPFGRLASSTTTSYSFL